MAWVLLATGAVPAATVRARVVDESGSPFPRMQTELIDLVAGRVIARTETGRDGIAIFDDLLHGQFRISIDRGERTVVHPDDNPLVRPADFSVVDPRETIEVELEVHRGIPIHVVFHVDDSVERHRATARLRELESGKRLERTLFEGESVIKLFPGRWQIKLDATPGLLLESVDVEERQVASSVVELDARPGNPATVVTWQYRAIARITGRVLFERDPFPVNVVARLLEPGPWWAAAGARETQPAFETIAADVEPGSGRYLLELPEGRWSVAPTGMALAAAEPEAETVDLRPGEERRASFVVRGRDEQPATLEVAVKDPDGEPVGEAVVELWPLDDEARLAREGLPLLRAISSEISGTAEFVDVPDGDYRIAAAHPDFPEASIEVFDYDFGEEDTAPLEVTLNQGGRIEVALVDPDGLATGDTWVVASSDDAGPYYVRDKTITSGAQVPRTLVDRTGHAVLRGLYPGTYELAALTPTAFVRFRDGDERDGEWVEKLELHLHPNEVRRLEAHVVPAGLLTGRAYCRDGAPIPSRVDLRIVPNKLQPEHPRDVRWQDAVALALDGVPLSGGAGGTRDRFDAGPLEASSYVVALRPAGFDRWTWAFGTEDGADAGSFEVQEGQQVDLGSIGVDCGPAIRIVPQVASAAPAPDLRDLRLQSDLVEVAGEVRTVDGETVGMREVAVTAHERSVWLHGLVEGAARLEIRLGHRYFLPEFWIDVPIVADLERGGTLTVPLEVADVGGAIAIRALGASAARLVRDDGPLPPQALDGERATLTNVPPGTYRVELCKDAACTEKVYVWQDVAVDRLTTTRLAHGFPDAEAPGSP